MIGSHYGRAMAILISTSIFPVKGPESDKEFGLSL